MNKRTPLMSAGSLNKSFKYASTVLATRDTSKAGSTCAFLLVLYSHRTQPTIFGVKGSSTSVGKLQSIDMFQTKNMFNIFIKESAQSKDRRRAPAMSLVSIEDDSLMNQSSSAVAYQDLQKPTSKK